MTFELPDAIARLDGERIVWAAYPTTRNVRNLIRNCGIAWSVLRDYRPDVIVSTGAGVAAPFFWWGRLLGITTVYLEVFDRIDTPTLTSRLCHPFSDLFLVQWEEQQLFHRDAVLLGPLW